MEFIGFDAASDAENVIVVDAYLPGRLNLSHWRGVELPLHLQADTSTEIVLMALKSDQFTPDDYRYCTNNHFDIDGFLGIWALMNPEEAIKNEVLLREMAAIGDFRELNADKHIAGRAMSLVCKINELEKSLFYPPFGMDLREPSACIPKYEYFLREFGNLLEGNYEPADEYTLVSKQMKDLSQSGEVSYLSSLRLLIVYAPYPMHYYALFAESKKADMVLTIYPDHKYELEEKYSTWVQTVRKSYPRILLSNLAEHLNASEKSGYRWKGDHFTDTGPILRLTDLKLNKAERFDHPMNRTIHSSSIAEDEIVEILTSYISEKYQDVNPKVNWTWEELRAFNA
ncbi:MAG: DUF6687 family protein [Cyclobacteriaceae bacterium]